jgi:hypothetical protein
LITRKQNFWDRGLKLSHDNAIAQPYWKTLKGKLVAHQASLHSKPPVDGDYSFDDEIDILISKKSARRPSTTSDETNWRSQIKIIIRLLSKARQHPGLSSRISILWLSVLVRRTLPGYPNFAGWLQGPPGPPGLPAITFCL